MLPILPIFQHPPKGAPWDSVLVSAPLVFLDLEMTGTDVATDRICEIAALRMEGERETARLNTLINPKRDLGESTKVHGLTKADLASAPTLSELRRALNEILEGAVAVGHRIDFDLAFLQTAAQRDEVDPVQVPAICTFQLAKRVWRRQNYSLHALCAHAELDLPTHRAWPDVIACRALLGALQLELNAQTPRHLHQAQHLDPGTMRFRDDVMRQLQRAQSDRKTVRLTYRIPGKDPRTRDYEVWAMSDSHAEGRLTGHGQRIMRADRILRVEPTDVAFDLPADFQPSNVLHRKAQAPLANGATPR